MKTIEPNLIEKLDDLSLSNVIVSWEEYTPNSVLIAYAELIRRDYAISWDLYEKMLEFRRIQLLFENA